MEDIYKSASKVCFNLFTDGTCLFYSNYKKIEIGVNIFLDNIASWLKTIKLILNVKKQILFIFDDRKTVRKNL